MTLEAFEILTQRIRPRLLSIGKQILRTEEDAEDVTQDALLRLWIVRDRLDRYENQEAFAAAVCRNLCLSRLRKASQRIIPLAVVGGLQATQAIGIMRSEDSPLRQLEEQENDLWLADTINGLPAAMMLVMKMSQNDRLDNGEIARALGISETTVRTALCKARKKLLEALKNRK